MNQTASLKNQYNAAGMREGIWETFYDNDAICSRWTYKNGRLHGLTENFSIEGFTTLRAEFEDGVFHGTVEIFDSEGNLHNREKFIKGKFVVDESNHIAVTGDRHPSPHP